MIARKTIMRHKKKKKKIALIEWTVIQGMTHGLDVHKENQKLKALTLPSKPS